jgi:hypothetical protein
MSEPWTGDSFYWPHGIRWLTRYKAETLGSDKQTLDGSIISVRLTTENRVVRHKFRARWVPGSTVEALKTAANVPGQTYRVFGKNCFFPPDANIDATPINKSEDFVEYWILGTSHDLWNVDFEVIFTGD